MKAIGFATTKNGVDVDVELLKLRIYHPGMRRHVQLPGEVEDEDEKQCAYGRDAGGVGGGWRSKEATV
jgi:hypothetical protein